MDNEVSIIIPGLTNGGINSKDFDISVYKLLNENPNYNFKVYINTWDHEYNNLNDIILLCEKYNLWYDINQEKYTDIFDNIVYQAIQDSKILHIFVEKDTRTGLVNKCFIHKMRHCFAIYYKTYKVLQQITNKQSLVIKIRPNVYFNIKKPKLISCEGKGFLPFPYDTLNTIKNEVEGKANENYNKDEIIIKNNTIYGYIDFINSNHQVRLQDKFFIGHYNVFDKIFLKYKNEEYLIKDIILLYEKFIDIDTYVKFFENIKNIDSVISNYQCFRQHMKLGMYIFSQFLAENHINIISDKIEFYEPFIEKQHEHY